MTAATTPVEGTAVCLLRDDVNTDVILASRDMASPSRRGLGKLLFGPWRYLPSGAPDERFVLNQIDGPAPSILLTGANFGCGSSREYAVWALLDYGFRCIIAPSFGNIFRENCLANGIVPISVPRADVAAAAAAIGFSGPLAVDLTNQVIRWGRGSSLPFDLGAADLARLRAGDAVAATLARSETIDAFFAADRAANPWKYSRVDNPAPDRTSR